MTAMGRDRERSDRRRLLVVGAGEAGRSLAREIRDGEFALEPVAFVDDDTVLSGGHVLGLPVLGGVEDLVEAVSRSRAEEILIAIPSATGPVIRRLVLLCRRAGLPFRIAPGIRAIIEGDVHFAQVREVAPEDLLGRETVSSQAGDARALIQGRSVMITGAGGSIGAELCRRVGELEPSEILLLGRGENSLHEISQELSSRFPKLHAPVLIADVRDRERMDLFATRHRPEFIFHTAAHKHVPLMEGNPEEAVFVNVCGTANLIRFARRVAAERFVLISTDKAVAPTSVMGATKRVAEMLVSAVGQENGGTRFMTVRFGNVLGSRGSVVPVFQKCIRRGEPLPVTDDRMTRYFMTVKEAVLLVIETMVIGENAATYILEMGDPVPIVDLARNMLALAGYDPENGDMGCGIVSTGLRPGEKLHEVLVDMDERLVASRNPLINRAESLHERECDPDEILATLVESARRGEVSGVRAALAKVLGSQEFLS